MKIPIKVKKIMQKLIDGGYEVVICGGAVRDYLLGIEPHDYDIFTNAGGESIKELFPDGNILGNEKRQEKILTVIVDDIEVSSFRSNGDRTLTKQGTTLKQHQATCDFTINAMAADINGKMCGDIYFIRKCMEDIDNGLLRFVGNPEDRIKEDKLRILRGIRFAIKYELGMDGTTRDLLLETDLSDIPPERIKDELVKIIKLDFESSILIDLKRFLPKELFIREMNLEGGIHHDESPYNHSLNAFTESCKITNNPLIRLAALLHDVGKGVTRTEENGEIHFYQHHKVGAKIVREWMENLKFSKYETDFVSEMVYNHMWGYNDIEPSDKSYIKLFNRLESANITIEDYVMQLYADNQGNMAKPKIKFGDFIKFNTFIKKYYKLKYSEVPFKVSDLKISGKDVMDILELKPGPDIGILLKEIFDLVMDGELENKRSVLLNDLKRR